VIKKYKQLPEEVRGIFEILIVGIIAMALLFFGIFK
jgi:hypothetical protein